MHTILSQAFTITQLEYCSQFLTSFLSSILFPPHFRKCISFLAFKNETEQNNLANKLIFYQVKFKFLDTYKVFTNLTATAHFSRLNDTGPLCTLAQENALHLLRCRLKGYFMCTLTLFPVPEENKPFPILYYLYYYT